jgi:hypothetical protein
MRYAMSFSEHFLAGFALAATIAKDPAAQLARAGLAADVVASITRVARETAELSKSERRARIRRWTTTTTTNTTNTTTTAPTCALPTEPAQPVRAFALLAHRSTGTSVPAWLRNAPLPRAGYAPDRQLTSLLLRMAARVHAVTQKDASGWDE